MSSYAVSSRELVAPLARVSWVAVVLAFAVAIAMVALVKPASAKATEISASTNISSQAAAAMHSELVASRLPMTTRLERGIAMDTFELRKGTSVSVPRPGPSPSTRLSAGSASNRIYVQLNSSDQKALKSGAAAALGVALCAIPAVGWAACAGIAAALAVGLHYLNAHGICPSSKPNMRIFITGGNSASCVR